MFLDELKIQQENFTCQKIDSAFYRIILKNNNYKYRGKVGVAGLQPNTFLHDYSKFPD
jgi:hypothetical protein